MYSQIDSKGLLLYIAISVLLVSSSCINIAEGSGDEHIRPVKSSEPNKEPNNSKSYCVMLNSIEADDWTDGFSSLFTRDTSPEPYGRVCAINSDDRRYHRRTKHLLSGVLANCKDLWFEKDKQITERNWISTDFILNFDDIKNMYKGNSVASTISGTKTINARQTITVGDSTRDTVDVLILPIQEHDGFIANPDDPLYDYTGGGTFDGNCPETGAHPAGCDKGYKDDFPIVISLNDTNLTGGGEHNFTRELRGERKSSSFIGSTRYYYQKLIFSFTFSNGACR